MATRRLACLQAACLLTRRALLSESGSACTGEPYKCLQASVVHTRSLWSWVKTASLQQKFEDRSLAVENSSVPSLPLCDNTEEAETRLFSQINVEVNGHDEAVLESYSQFVRRAAKILNIDISGRIALPIRRQRFTLLKSPHIYKKHRVQYEIRTHRRLLQLHQLTGDTADVFLEYIQRNLPEGVSMKIEQVELEDLDVELPVDAQTYLESK